MNITLIGNKGYVGSFIKESIINKGLQLFSYENKISYENKKELKYFLYENKIDFLINAAGYVGRPNVDACEKNKTACLFGNSIIPGIIREVCEDLQIPFGHISSGCIYEGDNQGLGFSENDPPNFSFRTNNSSFYSGCKALGEEVLKDCNHCYIWRLRVPFNNENNPRNYLYKLINYKTLLNVRNSLSNIQDFSNGCIDSIIKKVPYGTYNMTNSGSVTTEEVVDLLKATIAKNHQFNFYKNETDFMQNVAAPRSSCVLNNNKALDAGINLPNVYDSILESLNNWRN